MSEQDNRLYVFEPFVLDAGSRILLKHGSIVRLTPKAFETLLVLVQNGVQVVEKERLLKEVWPDSFVEEGSLSRNIHELRKALGDDSAEPRYIETIPKRGYRFVAPVKLTAVAPRPGEDAALEGNATVIEKHTFARVISEGFDGDELPVRATALPASVSGTKALPEPTLEQPAKPRYALMILGVGLLAAAVYFLLKLPRKVPAPSSRAKPTLVRLTNNAASDLLPVWSPDGSKIVFCSNRDGKNEIYVMDADGGNLTRLTNNLADDDVPKWSPDGRKIVFDSERDGNKEIYVMDADGGNQTRLTRNESTDTAASWSPDGSRIAFASNRDNSYPFNFDIYVMNADGTGLKRLVNDLEYDAEPRWSPDGTKILFVTGRNESFDIYEMNPEGIEQKNITEDSRAADGAPAWSLDGSNIAFVSNRDGKDEIYVMDADRRNLKRVTYNAVNDSRPSFSPDASKLVFQSDRDGNWEIYVMSVDGELDQLTDDAANDIDPAWSPDGTRIAFSSNRAGMQHIYLMNADGSSLTQLTNSPADDTKPAWSLDGKRIAFTSSRDGNTEIYSMLPDGNQQTRLTNDPGIDICPSWSPDGRIFFNSTRDKLGAIYVMNNDGAQVTRLTSVSAGQPACSPAGGKFAFVGPSIERMDGAFPPQVFVSDDQGRNVSMVTQSPTVTGAPSWSSDGSSILFVKVLDRMGAKANIFRMDSSGGNVARLTAGPKGDLQPAVSPDGARLVFQSNRTGNFEIYVMSLR